MDVLTVPLGGLAEAYLEALATIEHDRMGSISTFIAVAGQLILIKSRAMLPRPPVTTEAALEDEGVDPEAELRARLLLYRAFRDAGAALQLGATERVGLFRREPSAALASGLAVAAATAPATHPIDPGILVRALDGLVEVLPEPGATARDRPAHDHARPAGGVSAVRLNCVEKWIQNPSRVPGCAHEAARLARTAGSDSRGPRR